MAMRREEMFDAISEAIDDLEAYIEDDFSLIRRHSLTKNRYEMIPVIKAREALRLLQTSGTNPLDESGPQPVRNVYPLDSEYK